MRDTIIIMFNNAGKTTDVEIPSNITADELLHGLNVAFDLGVDEVNAKGFYMRSENPIALIKGDMTISELGIRTGTTIFAQ